MRKIIIFLSLMLWISGASAQQASVTLEPDTNRPGMDYRSFDLQDARPELCRQACERDEKCRAYTYIKPGIQGPNARCWLKSGIPAPKKGGCCVSGVKTITAAQGQQPKPMKSMPGTTQVLPKPSASTPGSPPAEGYTAVLSKKGEAPKLKALLVAARTPEKPLNRKELVNLMLAKPLTAQRLNQLASTIGMPAQELATRSTSGKMITGYPKTISPLETVKAFDWDTGVRFTPKSNNGEWTVFGVAIDSSSGIDLSEMCQRDELFLYGKSDFLEIDFAIDMPPGNYAITIEFAAQNNPIYKCDNCQYGLEDLYPLMDKKAMTEGVVSIYTGYVTVLKQSKVKHRITFKKAYSIWPEIGFFRGITFTRL